MFVAFYRFLILDEIDRLLNLVFQELIYFIIYRLPKLRRTGLFSATQTEAVEELAKAGLRNLARVEVRTETKLLNGSILSEQAVSSETPSSLNLESFSRYFMTIVVFNTGACSPTSCFSEGFQSCPSMQGYETGCKDKALCRFRSVSSGFLLCTDVAACGLDISGVDFMIQQAFQSCKIPLKIPMSEFDEQLVWVEKEMQLFSYCQRRNQYESQCEKIEEAGANLLIGTPGRLFDSMEQIESLNFKTLE
ncbi:hypothetical protein TorRG33x02_315190, partial [Trema orientale]